MKLLKNIIRRIKHSHDLSIRRSRIHYSRRQKADTPTQLNFESILK